MLPSIDANGFMTGSPTRERRVEENGRKPTSTIHLPSVDMGESSQGSKDYTYVMRLSPVESEGENSALNDILGEVLQNEQQREAPKSSTNKTNARTVLSPEGNISSREATRINETLMASPQPVQPTFGTLGVLDQIPPSTTQTKPRTLPTWLSKEPQLEPAKPPSPPTKLKSRIFIEPWPPMDDNKPTEAGMVPSSVKAPSSHASGDDLWDVSSPVTRCSPNSPKLGPSAKVPRESRTSMFSDRTSEVGDNNSSPNEPDRSRMRTKNLNKQIKERRASILEQTRLSNRNFNATPSSRMSQELSKGSRMSNHRGDTSRKDRNDHRQDYGVNEQRVTFEKTIERSTCLMKVRTTKKYRAAAKANAERFGKHDKRTEDLSQRQHGVVGIGLQNTRADKGNRPYPGRLHPDRQNQIEIMLQTIQNLSTENKDLVSMIKTGKDESDQTRFVKAETDRQRQTSRDLASDMKKILERSSFLQIMLEKLECTVLQRSQGQLEFARISERLQLSEIENQRLKATRQELEDIIQTLQHDNNKLKEENRNSFDQSRQLQKLQHETQQLRQSLEKAESDFASGSNAYDQQLKMLQKDNQHFSEENQHLKKQYELRIQEMTKLEEKLRKQTVDISRIKWKMAAGQVNTGSPKRTLS